MSRWWARIAALSITCRQKGEPPMLSKLRRIVCTVLVFSLAATGFPSPACAGLVSTEDALGAERAYVNSVIDRAEVRAQLEVYGVSPAQAKARVAALSDADAADLANRIASLPAGADGGVGALIGA